MSQENVEVVVSALEKWNSGDDTGALESLAADVEVHHNIGRGTPLEGIYQGHAEVRKLWADMREAFAEARFDIGRATEHDGVVLVLGTLRLRGTGSGAVADTPFGLVTEFEHGVGKRQFFWTGDQSKALEAMGLREYETLKNGPIYAEPPEDVQEAPVTSRHLPPAPSVRGSRCDATGKDLGDSPGRVARRRPPIR